MVLAHFTFKIMMLIALLATVQVGLVHSSVGLLGAVAGATEAQTSVLCILQGADPVTCMEGLK
jgi:rRNA processing protein Krr1/Pno1